MKSKKSDLNFLLTQKLIKEVALKAAVLQKSETIIL